MRDDEKDYQTANNLRAWREHRGLSQSELGKLVDTTQAVISHLEKAERKLSTQWLHRLASALRIQPGHLVDYDPRTLDRSTLDLIEAAAAIAEEDRPFTKELIDTAAGIAPEDRETAMKVLKQFLKSA